jgi:hypothetical protein
MDISTQKVEEVVEPMGAKDMSKSEVARMAAVLDQQVKAFQARRRESRYPYFWLEARYVKVRKGGRTVSGAVLAAIGVAETGAREVIGVTVASWEMAPCWKAFLQGLVGKGLGGVQMVTSDAHSGLCAAIRAVLNGVTWQRCMVHSKITPNTTRVLKTSLAAVFRPRAMESSSAMTGLRSTQPMALGASSLARSGGGARRMVPQATTRQSSAASSIEPDHPLGGCAPPEEGLWNTTTMSCHSSDRVHFWGCSARKSITSSPAIANPTPSAASSTLLYTTTPRTSPCLSARGPPLFPGLIAASV